MTTLCTIWAALRTCTIRPLKVSPGKASTVNFAGPSTRTRPMSASSTLASTCIFVRSLAMVKRVGAARLAATVCPTSTARDTTTPSTGARIVVYSRSRRVWCNAASFCSTCARAACSIASATRSCAWADTMAPASDSSLARAASSMVTAVS